MDTVGSNRVSKKIRMEVCLNTIDNALQNILERQLGPQASKLEGVTTASSSVYNALDLAHNHTSLNRRHDPS